MEMEGGGETRREWLLRWHSASYCFIHGILCGVDTTQDMEEKGLHGSWPMVGACCSGFCLGCQLEGERNMSTGCESRAVLIKHYPSVKITEIGCNISDVLREGGQPGDSFSFSFPVQLNSKICCAAAAHPACRSMTPGRDGKFISIRRRHMAWRRGRTRSRNKAGERNPDSTLPA